MAVYTFDFYYEYAGTNINTETAGTFSFEVDDGQTLVAGDEVTGLLNGSPVQVIYTGTTPAGEPFFQVISNGQNYFLSNNDYGIGANQVPAHDADPFPVCFLAGTLVSTPGGAVAIEDLAIGDPIMTSDGRVGSVKWVGRQTLIPAFGLAEERRPVSIAAGALAAELPARELRLTSDHALLLDGVLVQAGALVNGTTIRRMTLAELGERLVVYHVELDDHALILAEGTPAETFVDNVTRRRFDNYAEYEALFGACEAGLPEMELPRVKSARQLPRAVRERLAERAGALGIEPAVAA
ncbi:Hint domain-containing protein [Chelatococcus reniformis]|uniref:Hedgehog/Intein (Hint) domain-containing protein n=1 Tax=Chelatococcus reniformis TaxID=1494448 RepID=A0A916XFK2_9HYPH|nr:Hint domain-containing protein [Chelatococcus reniformis]GGC68234.1 hypothetical protein GCM10010994_28510 [Chelatococcus reniformis]